MNRRWTFTALEFVTLWEEQREAGLPEPFQYRSGIRLRDDFRREQRLVREKLRANWDPTFDGVLESVARPDIRLAVHGWDSARPKDPQTLIRLHAARKGDRAILMRQLPGETVQHSGGFVIVSCEVLAMARLLVAALPVEPAGTEGDVPLPAHRRDDDEDDEYRESELSETAAEVTRYRAEQFLRGPMTRMGLITISQGISQFGPRGVVRRKVQWLDRTGDGRYVITQGRREAVAADAARFTALLNTEIAAIVRAIKDERGR